MDIALVQRAQKHEEQAFLELLSSIENDLYRTAYAYLHNEHEAVEAVQEVTVRIYQQLPKLREPSYAKTWMIRIMMNYCADRRKKLKRTISMTDEHMNQPSNGIISNLGFLHLLEQLTEERKRIIIYRFYLQASIKEIAAIEKVPEGTVKSRIHHSLQQLRTQLVEQGGDSYDFEQTFSL